MAKEKTVKKTEEENKEEMEKEKVEEKTEDITNAETDGNEKTLENNNESSEDINKKDDVIVNKLTKQKKEDIVNTKSDKNVNDNEVKKTESNVEVNKEQEDEDKPPVNEKQLMWFILSLVIVIVAIVGGALIISESREFSYIGLNFEKQKFNDFFIYTGHVVGTNVNADPINFQLSLRNDPRTNDVPIERNIIIKDKDRPIYVALNMSSGIHECGSVPLVALGQFINGIGHKHVTTATTKEAAEELDLLYSNCDNNSGSTVLLITTGNKTEIVVNEDNGDCYEIRVNNCELGEALEKAQLSILSELSRVPL